MTTQRKRRKPAKVHPTLSPKLKRDRERMRRLTEAHLPFFVDDCYISGGQGVYSKDPRYKRPRYNQYKGHVKKLFPAVYGGADVR